MNDLEHNQLSNPNQSLKLVMTSGGNHQKPFSDISTTLAKDFFPSHSLSKYHQILRADEKITLDDFMLYPLNDILKIF